ncbi:MAG: pyrroloquinoline quinone-dependent dehydrogenase [Gemmatimonadaceae bacterium]
MRHLSFVLLAMASAPAAAAQAGPSQRTLNAAGRATDSWLFANHDYAGWRYVSAGQITRANVAQLRPLCELDLGVTPPFQTHPIVHQGTMFVTTTTSTVAISATDCSEVWRHERAPRDSANYPQQRGVALKDGLVVRGTSDGYLLALSAADGSVAWERKIADGASGEAITMPLMAFEDLVFAGPAGSEVGTRGWIGAFRLRTGEEVWRFNTVPREGEAALSTWGDPGRVFGGGVWGSLSLDPARRELYVPVGNATPAFNDTGRPGENLYTSSLVVLNARDGKMLWHQQQVPHDVRNWDVTQASPLYEATAGGKRRRLVAVTGKSGLLEVFDRTTRERIFVTAVTRVDTAATPEGRRCPGPFGGVVYNGPAFSPRTNMLYVPAVDWCATISKGTDDTVVPRRFNWGGSFAFDPVRRARGRITAVDAATGTVKWRYLSSRPIVAAVTATAGDIVFTGELSGNFIALDAQNGRLLFRYALGAPLNGGIISYTVRGRQYVAATSGTAGAFWQASGGPSKVTIFALD